MSTDKLVGGQMKEVVKSEAKVKKKTELTLIKEY